MEKSNQEHTSPESELDRLNINEMEAWCGPGVGKPPTNAELIKAFQDDFQNGIIDKYGKRIKPKSRS